MPSAVFQKELEDQIVTSFPAEAVFECSLVEDDTSVEWMKNDRPIKKGDKYDVIKDGKVNKLVVLNVEGADEGKYSVKVKKQTSFANLKVEGEHILICN